MQASWPLNRKVTLEWPALESEWGQVPSEYVAEMSKVPEPGDVEGSSVREQLIAYHRQELSHSGFVAQVETEKIECAIQGEPGRRYQFVLRARLDAATLGLPLAPSAFEELARSDVVQWPEHFSEDWSMPIDWSL